MRFFQEYKNTIQTLYDPLVKELDSTQLQDNIQVKKKLVNLNKAFDYVYKIIQELGADENWAIFNLPRKQDYNPDSISMASVYFFEIKMSTKKIVYENSKERPLNLERLYGGWILVKVNHFFQIRNLNALMDKFEKKAFSFVDKLFLNPTHAYDKVNKKRRTHKSFRGISPEIANKLDDHQKTAFLNAVRQKEIAVIKGPPGTGKTHLITRLVEHFVQKKQPVLFASALHSALDALMVQINKSAIMFNTKVVRTTHKSYSVRFSNFEKNKKRKKWSSQYSADLFVTTFASFQLDGFFISDTKWKKPILIVDEASTASLLDVLTKTSYSEKIIIVGDENQLRPISLKKEAQELMIKGLQREFEYFKNRSLFDHLQETQQENTIMLKNNYRSIPEIVNRVNVFYQNKLVSTRTENAKIGSPFELWRFPSLEKTIKFIKHVQEKQEVYSMLFLTYYRRNINTLRDHQILNFRTSASVQGEEADVVLYLLWNDNNFRRHYELGYRYVNVAISRARKKVIVVDFANNGNFKSNLSILKDFHSYFKFNDEKVSIAQLVKKKD